MDTRFWKKVEPTGFCWNWAAGRDRDGYGRFGLNRVSVLAHRVAYEALVGPIPAGHHLDHLCRNKTCVNPDHLEPVTAAENMRRRNAILTHCKNGHALEGSNLKVDRRGHRYCRACGSNNARRYRRRMAGAMRNPNSETKALEYL
ncbi:HNH endonuclease signature motif containing protein [Puerhibacterium puerhi]|uniref:HNH endonuclease signature motif containing protein n=1 Tax=Puerhibacterium puerhi TaxID=2692623 RepID=UPI001358F51A|nr:HNH endonuclease signature motif containing protein [Puerhibacterium puerhi]